MKYAHRRVTKQYPVRDSHIWYVITKGTDVLVVKTYNGQGFKSVYPEWDMWKYPHNNEESALGASIYPKHMLSKDWSDNSTADVVDISKLN